MHIAIAGGGIAGLTSAIALSARGFTVELFERAERLEEIGAGIQLSPNATSLLGRLGVLGALAEKASEPPALIVRDGISGAELMRLPFGQSARRRYGAPYLTLHRADLQATLLEAARSQPSIKLYLGCEVRNVEAGEGAVRFTAGDRSAEADALVAADGVRSTIRTGYFGHPGPKPLGRSAWRALLPAESIRDRISLDHVGLWPGARGHLVHYPVASGKLLNVVVIARGEDHVPPLAPFGAKARGLIEGVSDWSLTPLVAVDSRLPWTRGRVVLVGDAAHAMPPTAAQGGVQAIEDAWSLAASLAATADVASALAAHERTRRPRVERVAGLSSANLNAYELAGVPAFVRNIAMKVLPASLVTSRLDWLFGFSPE